MTESIQLKGSTTGTKIHFFSTNIAEGTDGAVPSYLLKDARGQPFYIVEDISAAEFSRDGRNIFKRGETFSSVSGMSYQQIVRGPMSPIRREKILKDYISGNKSLFGASNESWVGFTEGPIDDYFVDVKMVRTYDTLDTLSIHNSVEGAMPVRESPTGVLYGRIEAVQKINDENGNKLRIPLANVVVAIFNSTEEFPAITSTDESGNRIMLNIRENSPRSTYFNDESFAFDSQFLQEYSGVMASPPKYKHTVVTNGNGEFILMDVPVGEQTFMFEVDLLKQGLTKDEIALNLFPYPPDDTPFVDTLPHYYFKQFSVNILPSYGDFQTGYTELNVSVPLDMRKWTTYYTFPISAYGKTLDQMRLNGFSRAFTFGVRNMAKPGFPNTSPLEIVEIEDILRKAPDQQLEWENETKTNRQKLEFRESDYFSFKLPANMYDPTTTRNGIRGVWLSGYQFKAFYIHASLTGDTPADVYRATGYNMDFIDGAAFHRSHYNLNRRLVSEDKQNTPLWDSQLQRGTYPYEKPWSPTYPSKYRIPDEPKNLNPGKQPQTTNPKYTDGDKTDGWRRQIIDGQVLSSYFAQRISNGELMRYETDVSWNERYSNGHLPLHSSVSRVNNGEVFQRLEAGYGYWMRPDGWPDVVNGNDIDWQKADDANVARVNGEFITLSFDERSPVTKGGLTFYRVLQPNSRDEPFPPFRQKFISMVIGQTYRQRGRTTGERESEIQVDLTDRNDQDKMMTFGFDSGHGHKFTSFRLFVVNKGSRPVEFGGKLYQPGQVLGGPNGLDGAASYTLTLESNSGYNVTDNSYLNCVYGVSFRAINNSKDSGIGDVYASDLSVAAGNTDSIPTYKLRTYYSNMRTNYNSKKEKCKDFKDFLRGDKNYNHSVRIEGIIFIDSRGTKMTSTEWSTEGITVTCNNDNAIPYEVV